MLIARDLVVRVADWSRRYDLAAAPGTLTALTGPSGGGKTTLLHAIAGFERDCTGTLTLDGHDLLALPPEARPASILFQDHNLFPGLTARANAALGLTTRARLAAEERNRVDDALAMMGLGGLEERMPAMLSGGQRQRVALARALLMDRPILLLDEPLTGLEPPLRRELGALIADVVRTRSLIGLITTHTLEDVEARADGVIEIR